MSANAQPAIHIAAALPADVDEIHDLEARAFPNPWRREFFDSELRGSGRYNLVARKHGRIVGYVFTMWFFDEMHINKIAVDERERRQGIALADAAKAAAQPGVGESGIDSDGLVKPINRRASPVLRGQEKAFERQSLGVTGTELETPI